MTQKQQLGPGARKISLERRLDANTATTERGLKGAAPSTPPACERAPSLADGKHDPNEEQTQEMMDQAIEDSFPASDPPAHASASRLGPAAPTRRRH